MKSYKLFTFMSVFLLIFILITSNAFAEYGSSRAGFFDGMWDGTVWIGHLIEKIYSVSYVYNDHNNGFFYNLGFFGTLAILSWNIGFFLSMLIIAWDIFLMAIGFIVINKTQITAGAFALIIIVILFALNEKIEIWRNKRKKSLLHQDVKNTADLSNKKLIKIYYKNSYFFCDGNFIYERSSKTKVDLSNVTNIHFGETNNIGIEFIKKDGSKGSMTILVSEISENSLVDISKLSDYVRQKISKA